MCDHKNVSCVNPYEIIRKYKCSDCGAIMMCSCDEYLGKKYFKHQINTACILETQERIQVTHGFQKNICPECRHEKSINAPSNSYGNTSKIKKYYWREIYLRSLKLYDIRYNSNNLYEIDKTKMEIITEEVINNIKNEHLIEPKYEYKEISQNDFLKQYSINILQRKVIYHNHTTKKALVELNGELLTVEEYGTRVYDNIGYYTLQTESRPFHVIFGIYLFRIIEDPNDPLIRPVNFGSRTAYDKNIKDIYINMLLPRDFGTSGYFERRKEYIINFISSLNIKNELFHENLLNSYNLREYLWAHRQEDIEKAEKIVKVLDIESLKRILTYLIMNYWKNYCGWPDLFIYKSNEFKFIEVKGSGDKLREDQKNWIINNNIYLKFNFEILKLIK